MSFHFVVFVNIFHVLYLFSLTFTFIFTGTVLFLPVYEDYENKYNVLTWFLKWLCVHEYSFPPHKTWHHLLPRIWSFNRVTFICALYIHNWSFKPSEYTVITGVSPAVYTEILHTRRPGYITVRVIHRFQKHK